MPWNSASFRDRHNHGLSASQSGQAAKQANAILKKTGDEGLAIAVANKNARSHFARGGIIKEVAGKPIGKDDGLIAAQRGEFVVKKSAVKKLGAAVLNEINKGQLPSERLYGSRKAVARDG